MTDRKNIIVLTYVELVDNSKPVRQRVCVGYTTENQFVDFAWDEAALRSAEPTPEEFYEQWERGILDAKYAKEIVLDRTRVHRLRIESKLFLDAIL